jgi:lipoprotein-anchoring transpeptidase ErfK/SrfK
MRKGLALVLLLAALLAAPLAQAQPEIGEGCGAGERSLRDPDLAFAAYARGSVNVYKAPGGERFRTFRFLNPNEVRTVFGVLAARRDASCVASWYRVQLPMRPNESTGWVRADEVALEPVRTRLEVDLSRHRVSLFRDGRLVLRTIAATGTPGTPTPTGSYYVDQRFRISDSGGEFGPAAIGISAFSPVLQEWAQGGPIAIHGTNAPSSVGQAVSHGCLRVHNRVAWRLLWATETGSPVVIRA